MVADHWFMQIDKILEAMEITSDTTRIRLVAFQLEGEAQVWWNWAKTSKDLEAMTWAEFQELFMGRVPGDVHGQSSRSCSWASIFRTLLDMRRLRSS